MTKKRIQVELRDGRLLPVSVYDAELLGDCKNGQLFDMTRCGKRSNPQHNMYWSMLRNVCKATGKWPDEQHLHAELKLACGFYMTKFSELGGDFMRVPDSINFDAMDQQEFQAYFDAAAAKLSEALGFDPLEQPSQ